MSGWRLSAQMASKAWLPVWQNASRRLLEPGQLTAGVARLTPSDCIRPHVCIAEDG